MATPRPPSIPPGIDEYDGHGDYRERIREIVSFKPQHWLGVLIAFGVWYASGRIALVLMDSGPGTSWLLPLVCYVVFGFIGCIAYCIALGFASSRHASRGVLAAGALLILFAAFYPFALDLDLRRVPDAAADPAARERWLDELRERGNVGAPGVVPPFLAVREHDGAMLVRNVSGRPLLVQLARVSEERGADGLPVWQRCGMFNGYSTSDEDNRYWLPPHVSAWFRFGCSDRFAYWDVEYRIGDERTPPELGWRSTSAFLPAIE